MITNYSFQNLSFNIFFIKIFDKYTFLAYNKYITRKGSQGTGEYKNLTQERTMVMKKVRTVGTKVLCTVLRQASGTLRTLVDVESVTSSMEYVA